MLKRYLIAIAIIIPIFALVGNVFGQNTKRKPTKQATGGTIPVYSNRKNSKAKTSKPKNSRSFSSTTQPFADGLVLEKRKNRNSRTKVKSPKGSHNLLPYIEQNNRQKGKSNARTSIKKPIGRPNGICTGCCDPCYNDDVNQRKSRSKNKRSKAVRKRTNL